MDLEIESIADKISRNTDFGKLDKTTISDYVHDAVRWSAQYPLLKDYSLERAIYLYACHELFVDVGTEDSKFKQVKAENAQYTRFEDSNRDKYLDDLKSLLNELGIGQNHVRFY